MSQQKYTFNDVSVFEKPGLDAEEQNGLQTFSCSTVPLHDKLLSLKNIVFSTLSALRLRFSNMS